MAKSKDTFMKRERETKRRKRLQEKKEKMEERKSNPGHGKSLEDMIAFVDENGNIVSTLPDDKFDITLY